MPNPSFSRRLERAALEIAWRQWTEAGVAGWSRGSPFVVDPEALILLTALVGRADPRLRDEATDWCISYGRYVSVARLRNMIRSQPDNVTEAFGPFAATVAEHSGHDWPAATTARRYVPTERSRIDDFTRPSLITLRLRASLGVGARAEIIRILLAHEKDGWTAADLADDACFTKRNVADALEALQMGGLVDAAPVRNQKVYRLRDEATLHAFAGPAAARQLRWPEIVRIFAGLVRLAGRFPNLDARVKLVESVRFLSDHGADLRRAGLDAPRLEPGGDSARTFERWAVAAFDAIANGSDPRERRS